LRVVETVVPGELYPSDSSTLAASLGDDWDSGFLLPAPELTPPKKPRIRGVLATPLLLPSSPDERSSLWRAWMCSGNAETDNAIARPADNEYRGKETDTRTHTRMEERGKLRDQSVASKGNILFPSVNTYTGSTMSRSRLVNHIDHHRPRKRLQPITMFFC
jgi:hypothetical protein